MADELLEWIGSGKTLRDWCRQDGKRSWSSVYAWRDKDELFAKRFARARDMGFDAIAEEALSIADTPTDLEDDVQHRKLQIDTRLKLLAKWSPRRYGDAVGLGDEEDVGRFRSVVESILRARPAPPEGLPSG